MRRSLAVRRTTQPSTDLQTDIPWSLDERDYDRGDEPISLIGLVFVGLIIFAMTPLISLIQTEMGREVRQVASDLQLAPQTPAKP